MCIRDSPEVALRDAREAVAIAESVDDLLTLGDALSALGRVLIARGAREEAIGVLERAVEVYRAKGVVPAVASVGDLLATVTSSSR